MGEEEEMKAPTSSKKRKKVSVETVYADDDDDDEEEGEDEARSVPISPSTKKRKKKTKRIVDEYSVEDKEDLSIMGAETESINTTVSTMKEVLRGQEEKIKIDDIESDDDDNE